MNWSRCCTPKLLLAACLTSPMYPVHASNSSGFLGYQSQLSHVAVDTSEAEAALAKALAEAERTDRLVFLHSGAPWCGWCLRLEHWLEREDILPVFFKDFVAVKIDIEEMEGGQELIDRYAGRAVGVPRLGILHPDGSVLVTSVAPSGRNIGSPQAEWEVEHWNSMMRKAARRITEEEIEYMARTWAEDRTNL